MTLLYMEYRWWTPSLPICTHLTDKRAGGLVVSLPVDSMNSNCRVPILIFSETLPLFDIQHKVMLVLSSAAGDYVLCFKFTS